MHCCQTRLRSLCHLSCFVCRQGEAKSECSHSYLSQWLRNSGSGPEPKEHGNQGLAINQCVDDVAVDVEYEPKEQLLSFRIRIL